MVSRAVLPFVVILLALVVYLVGPIGRLIVAGAVVLLVPGYLLWSILGRDLHLPRLSAPALWLGLSLSCIPIVFLWSSTLGLRLTPDVLRLQAIGIALLAVWQWQRARHRSLRPTWLISGWSVIVGLTMLTRWLEIRDIALPLWVDSVHHTLLVRIINETGRIPTSLRPYLPADHVTYHWGYHTLVAAWLGVGSLPLATGVLWTGQILNAFIAVAMYALGAYVLRSPRGGLIAAGVVGLLSLMPAYYVTWGRYTQLTGLLLLPSLLIASMALAERSRTSWRLIGLNAVLLAGLMLVHYRVLVFYAAFMLPYALLLLIRRSRRIGTLVAHFAAVSVLAALLIGPWVVVMLRQEILPVATAQVSLAGSEGYNSIDWNLLNAGNNVVLYWLAAAGALLSALLWRWRVLAVAAWIAVMFVIANPNWFGLPPSWFINNHSVAITLFMPVGILVAYAIDRLIDWLLRIAPRAHHRWLRPAAAIVLAAFALFGAWQLRDVVNPVTVLAQPADVKAIDWAVQHTPPDARFLVNATYWLNGSYRGTDAGWWLLPLAGRWVSTPPALYIYGGPSYKAAVDALNQRVSALKPADTAQLKQLIRAEHISHIFIGSASGPIKPDMLFGDPAFTPVYDADGVTIFAVNGQS